MIKALRRHETICVAETYTVNSLPHLFDGDPDNKAPLT